MKKISLNLFFKNYFPLLLMFLGIGVVITIDLITKSTIVPMVENGEKIVLIPKFLELVYVENTGASFGIFKNNTLALTIVSAVSSIGLLIFMIMTVTKLKHPFYRVAIVLIIGGAIGNLYDRIALGYVRDFFNFMFIDFPVFNVADNALVIGTILLMVYVLFFYKDPKAQNKISKDNTGALEESGKASDSTESKNG